MLCAKKTKNKMNYSTYQKPPPGGAVILHMRPVCSHLPRADSKISLEAQQKYSTGYIQCMHEVHNMLLTCEWMDKTLGSRLLNHLLKSLPRSTDARPLQATQRQDGPPPGHGEEPSPGRQAARAGAFQSCPLGVLEMWRPW